MYTHTRTYTYTYTYHAKRHRAKRMTFSVIMNDVVDGEMALLLRARRGARQRLSRFLGPGILLLLRG